MRAVVERLAGLGHFYDELLNLSTFHLHRPSSLFPICHDRPERQPVLLLLFDMKVRTARGVSGSFAFSFLFFLSRCSTDARSGLDLPGLLGGKMMDGDERSGSIYGFDDATSCMNDCIRIYTGIRTRTRQTHDMRWDIPRQPSGSGREN